MDEGFTKFTAETPFYKGLTSPGPEDLFFGPDGALYVVYFTKPWFGDNAGNHIARIDYTGSCRPATPVPEWETGPTRLGAKVPSPRRTLGGFNEVDLSTRNLQAGTPVALFDIHGKEIPLRPMGRGVFQFENRPGSGMFFLRAGSEVAKLTLPE